MLAGVEDVDWASLSHAYGDASDVPELLRGSADQHGRLSAAEALWAVSGDATHVLPVLRDALAGDRWYARERALLIAAALGPDAAPLAPRVRALMTGAEGCPARAAVTAWHIRRDAAEVLSGPSRPVDDDPGLPPRHRRLPSLDGPGGGSRAPADPPAADVGAAPRQHRRGACAMTSPRTRSCWTAAAA
ncbi:hypothetical protein [Streptomyces sp. NPDC018059]|uniref:hypothetical protein n=1 Tax=Streptomyces sp. NPDC018059 TaxID=3365041 RepID=UPI00379A6D02